jgi:hypothetical protein
MNAVKTGTKIAFLIYLALTGGYWAGKAATELGAGNLLAATIFGGVITAALLLFVSMWRDEMQN